MKSNPTMDITINGKKYTMKATFEAMAEIEEHLGESYPAYLHSFFQDFKDAGDSEVKESLTTEEQMEVARKRLNMKITDKFAILKAGLKYGENSEIPTDKEIQDYLVSGPSIEEPIMFLALPLSDPKEEA